VRRGNVDYAKQNTQAWEVFCDSEKNEQKKDAIILRKQARVTSSPPDINNHK